MKQGVWTFALRAQYSSHDIVNISVKYDPLLVMIPQKRILRGTLQKYIADLALQNITDMNK